MKIDRDISLPFSYSENLVKYLIIIVIIISLVLVYDRFFRKKIIKIIHKPNIPKLKDKYAKRLDILYNDVQSNKIDVRNGYIRLSNIVRDFIEKATDIKVSSFSKSDAKKMGMDDLVLLMEEYYPPEFAKNDNSDILRSIKNSREIIQNWKAKS